MLKGRDLLGMTVVEAKSGKEIGRVEEVIPDFTNRTVLGLRIEKKSWFNAPKIVPFSSISNIGDSAIMVNEYIEGELPVSQERFAEIEKANEKMSGIEVITLEGKRLGIIEDIIVDNRNGGIKGFEISDGLIEDIISGRSYIPIVDNLQAVEDKIIVSPEFEGKIEDNFESIDETWR